MRTNGSSVFTKTGVGSKSTASSYQTDITVPSPNGDSNTIVQRDISPSNLLHSVGSGVSGASQTPDAAVPTLYLAVPWVDHIDGTEGQPWHEHPWDPLLFQYDPFYRNHGSPTQRSRKLSSTIEHGYPADARSEPARRQGSSLPLHDPRTIQPSPALLSANDLLRQQACQSHSGKMPISRVTSSSSSYTSRASPNVNNKPQFPCPVTGCNVSCSREDSLARHHKDSHNPNGPRWVCQGCRYWTSYCRADKMKEHCRKNHGAKDGEERFHVVQATPTPSVSSGTVSDDRSSVQQRRRHRG